MQQIIVIIIGLIVLGIICWKIYKLLAGKASAGSPCAGCEADCSLRRIHMENNNPQQHVEGCDKNY